MALIVCKECGKKISDASERCIHCGAMTADSLPVVETIPQEKPEPKAPEAKKDYYKLGEETRIQLEIDFLQQDAWAEKYRSKGLELKAFKETFTVGAVLPLMFTSFYCIALRVVLDIMGGQFQNITALWAAGIGVVSCVLIFGVLSTIFSKMSLRYERSNDRLIYLKKFQSWLRKEKNIAFQPLFDNPAEKEYFEYINLNNLDC